MDYVVRLTGQDNLSGTINNVKGAVNDLSNSVSNLDKFTDKFKRIEGSAAPLKRQLRDLKAIMADMNFQGLSGTEEFTKIAQYAGQVKDAMDDAGAATRRFADDTFALKAAADTMTVVTGAFTAATGAMSLFGVENENVKNAILKVQSAMAVLNGVQAIANALNKDSALMQALKAMRMKVSEAVTRANTNAIRANTVAENISTATTKKDTVAKAANTVAETVNSAATKKSTIIQNAWNVAKAVAQALMGNFTGLAIVAAGAIATYAMATADSTDKIEGQSKALKDNNKIADANVMWKERMKKSEEEWSDSVTQNASNQISQYTKLQLKWLECNQDQKLREKFQREYGDEVNRVAGKILKMSEYENFFVRDTDKVVAAILARAEAEAYADRYAKAILKKAENDRNGSRANGRFWTVYHEGDLLTDEEAAELHKAYGLQYYHGIDLVMTGKTDTPYKLSKHGADLATSESKKRADAIKAQDDAEIQYYQNKAIESSKKVAEAEKAAGMGHNYNPPKAFNGGGGSPGGNKGGNKGGSGDKKKPEEQVKPVAQSLEWLRQQSSELQKQLSYGLIPADKIEETKQKIEWLKKDIEAKEIELGFKVVPVKGSLEDINQQISKLNSDLEKGLVPDDKIEETNNKIKDLTKQKFELEVSLGIEEPLRTDFEKNDFADKYINDWKDLERYADEYAKKWEEYQQNLRKYEADVAEYNAAWDAYNANMVKYNEQQKQFAKYNDLLKKRDELESKHDNEQISDDKYEKESKALDEQIDKISNQLWPAVEDAGNALGDFNAKVADLNEQLRKGLITAEQYNTEFEKLCEQGEQLDNVMVKGFAKPIKPKIEMPKKPFDPMVHALIDDIYSALDGIPAHTEKLMSEVEEMLQNNELPIGVRIELANNVKQQLQERLDEQTHGKLSIKATVEPEYIETGSQWDMRKSYENQAQKINQVADDYAKGIIKSSSEARSQIAALNAELIKLGMKPIEIEIKTKGQQVLEDIQGYIGVFNTSIISTVDSFEQLARSIDEGASGWEIFKNTIAATEQVLTAFTTIMQLVNTFTAAHTAKKQADTAATKADIGVTLGDAAAKKAEAGAAAGEAVAETGRQNAKMGPFGWVAAIVGAVALAATLFSLIGKFAGGGIVGGNSFRGDKLIARVNSGEMILNGKQQKNLFDAINNNRLGSDGSQSISFKIKGSDLYGTLRNYSKIKGKSGVTTGIQ